MAESNERPVAIRVEGLEKRFGDVHAVRGVDFEVRGGETFGFLGPNGAGKSTTINMLCTLLRPTAGRATVAGFDVVAERDDVRREIGLVFQDMTLDTYLTGAQNLRFHGQLYGVPSGELETRMKQVLELVGLWDRRDKEVATFSGGMKRRLEIARGLLHSPRVLFLDEPTVGLDPQTRASIWEYLDQLRRQEDLTIFLTTHYMDEAEHCDRIAIMDVGQIVALDTPQALKAAIGTDRVRLVTADDDGRGHRHRRPLRPRGGVHRRRARPPGGRRRGLRAPSPGRPGRGRTIRERDPSHPRRRLHDLHRPHHPGRRELRERDPAHVPGTEVAEP